MKFIFIFIFTITMAQAVEGGKKDVDFDNLFKQLDKVITKKKDTNVIEEGKTKHKEAATSDREKKYKKFNEAAKKYHIFRAEKILKTVNELVRKYEKNNSMNVYVQRYSAIANKKFAYVSSKELNYALGELEKNRKTLKKLKNYKKLLTNIKQYDIKTISKVLIIVEQEIMNLYDMGIKKRKVKKLKKYDDMPVLLKTNKVFDNVKVVSINKSVAKLKTINF